MYLACLAAVVFVEPEGAFRLIFAKLHLTAVAPVHVLGVIPILKFLGFTGSFRNSVIGTFYGFRDTAGLKPGIFSSSIPSLSSAASIVLVRRAGAQVRFWKHFFGHHCPCGR